MRGGDELLGAGLAVRRLGARGPGHVVRADAARLERHLAGALHEGALPVGGSGAGGRHQLFSSCRGSDGSVLVGTESASQPCASGIRDNPVPTVGHRSRTRPGTGHPLGTVEGCPSTSRPPTGSPPSRSTAPTAATPWTSRRSRTSTRRGHRPRRRRPRRRAHRGRGPLLRRRRPHRARGRVVHLPARRGARAPRRRPGDDRRGDRGLLHGPGDAARRRLRRARGRHPPPGSPCRSPSWA